MSNAPILTILAGATLALTASSCGDCAGVPLSRLGETERTIAVGESFVATYEEGGSCNEHFAPVPDRARWTSAETPVVAVDSVTGRITGKQVGDALVVPNVWVTTGSWSVLVHVR
jgi:hypothetical protein